MLPGAASEAAACRPTPTSRASPRRRTRASGFAAATRCSSTRCAREFPHARSFLEVGCGNGYVLAAVARARPGIASPAATSSAAGLEHARRRVPDAVLLRADARALPFDGEFDVAGAFDVIEHVAEDEAVLAALRRAVRPGGGVIVTVPQHRWLWSETDRYSGHQRRYGRRELAAKLERAGLRLRWASSFVTLLLPLMAASRAWQALSPPALRPGARAARRRPPRRSARAGDPPRGARDRARRPAAGRRIAARRRGAPGMTHYLYPVATLLLTVYGQLVVKWQVDRAGALPADLGGKVAFVGQLLVNPWVISVFVAAFLAAASWMLAMTHFSLSDAYPVMALSFGLVLFGSALWLGESLTAPKVAGVAIIAVGLVVGSR